VRAGSQLNRTLRAEQAHARFKFSELGAYGGALSCASTHMT